MDQLDIEIAAYNRMREHLEANYFRKWVIFQDEELVGAYDDFQEAAKTTVKRFGRGPCLIRQVGRPPRTLPASIWARRVYADG